MSNEEFSFETEWPRTERRLANALRRRRVPAPMLEDVVQETGLRIFKTWERVDPDRGLWPLALTIAMNILKDHVRVEARRQETQPPRLAAVEPDPEVVALARLRLDRVREALPLLTEAQRDALLAEVGECDANGVSSSALKMLRMRARKRLREITGEAGLFGTIVLPIHRFLRSEASSTTAAQLAAVAPLAAGIIIVTIAAGPGAATASASERVNAPRATHASPLHRPLHLSPREEHQVYLRLKREAAAARDDSTTSVERDGKPSTRAADRKAEKAHTEEAELEDPVNPLQPPEVPTVVISDPTDPGAPADLSVNASALGHTVEAVVRATPGQRGGGDTGSLPTVEVEARLDDTTIVEPSP